MMGGGGHVLHVHADVMLQRRLLCVRVCQRCSHISPAAFFSCSSAQGRSADTARRGLDEDTSTSTSTSTPSIGALVPKRWPFPHTGRSHVKVVGHVDRLCCCCCCCRAAAWLASVGGPPPRPAFAASRPPPSPRTLSLELHFCLFGRSSQLWS